MMLAHVQFMFNHFWPVPFASRVMREATFIAVSLPVLGELVWVWQRLLGFVMAVWLARAALEAGLVPQEARHANRAVPPDQGPSKSCGNRPTPAARCCC
jgi:hypothetical protein